MKDKKQHFQPMDWVISFVLGGPYVVLAVAMLGGGIYRYVDSERSVPYHKKSSKYETGVITSRADNRLYVDIDGDLSADRELVFAKHGIRNTIYNAAHVGDTISYYNRHNDNRVCVMGRKDSHEIRKQYKLRKNQIKSQKENTGR